MRRVILQTACPEIWNDLCDVARLFLGECEIAQEGEGEIHISHEIAGGAPKLYKGASVTPVYEPIFLQINKLRQKVEAGAAFVQTQGIFDLDAFKRFLEQVDAAGIKTHVMAGIIPLKSAGMARYMNENVPGIAVPQEMIDRLAAAAEEGKAKGVKGLPMKLGMEMAAEMIAKIKDEHLCDGVHIMAIGAEKNVPTILDLAGITI